MRKLTFYDEKTLKDVNYVIENDEVIIMSNGQCPSIISDIFIRNYYLQYRKLPIFEKYIIEKSNSRIIFNRKEFYKNLPHKTLGTLIKLNLIEWKI
jgi:hypothetical protein